MIKQVLLFFVLLQFSISCLAGQATVQLLVGFDDSNDLKHEEFYMPYEKIGTVELNSKIWEIKPSDIDNKLSIDLFDDTYLTTIDRVNQNVNGTLSIRARFDDYPMGYFIINKTDEYINASISIPEKNKRYSIRNDVERGYTYLKRLDIPNLDYIESGPPLIYDEPVQLDEQQLKRLKKAAEEKSEDTVNVDVMIVYTPVAESWANANQGSIENVIAMSMEKAELTLENSNTKMTVRLVHSDLVNYTESGSATTDLSRLTDGWGPFSEVHDWRETYGADLVALFPHVSDVGGVAWLLTNKNGNPSHGFSLTRVQQAGTSYTHIHEMGHNMGCHHHKDQNMQPGPTNWFNWPGNNWSAGWRWMGDDDQMYCNVMTYESGQYFPDGKDATRVPYFSNPDIEYQGDYAGHPDDGDNARTLRGIRHVIAAYMEQKIFALTLTAYPEEGGEVDGEGNYKEGEEVLVTATPNEGFEFINWTDDDGDIISEDKSFDYQMPDEDITLTANFDELIYALNLNAEPEEGGTVEGDGEYEEGEEVYVLATPGEGFEFVNWTDDDGNIISEDESFYYIMPGKDVTLTANFDKLLYTLSLYVNPEEAGTVEGSGEYYYGEETEITADAKENEKIYEFINWTGDTEHVDDPESATTIVTMPNDNVELTANFGDVTSIEEPTDIDLTIFPNPANDKFNVESSEVIEQIRLINVNGQVVIDITVDALSYEVGVNKLNKGVYFMQIHTANKVITEKVHVAR